MKKKKSVPSAGKTTQKSGPFQDLSPIRSLCELLGQYGVTDFEWQSGDQKIALKTGSSSSNYVYSAPPSAPQPSRQMAASAPVPTSAPATSPKKGEPSANQKVIGSPFVGTFYRSASPGAAAYVKEGQTIKPGDVLCIVEAMKLMNEIEAEISGKIAAVLVENGQPVEFGEPLFLVDV